MVGADWGELDSMVGADWGELDSMVGADWGELDSMVGAGWGPLDSTVDILQVKRWVGRTCVWCLDWEFVFPES